MHGAVCLDDNSHAYRNVYFQRVFYILFSKVIEKLYPSLGMAPVLSTSFYL